jgi:hypothetical protein
MGRDFGRLFRRRTSEPESNVETPASGEASSGADRREEERIDKFGWARFQSGDVEGQGLATNLSLSGVMIERASQQLGPGTKVVLRLKVAGGYETVSIEAEVVRESDTGFALRFTNLEPRVASLLGDAIAGDLQ